MRFIADTHTHTLASGHAHSTVMENASAAKARGLGFLAVTDHACAIPGAPTELYFSSLPNTLPSAYGGIHLLTGCEANVIDDLGALDLSECILKKLDWVIASMHTLVLEPMDRERHTKAWLGVVENPEVDVLGHTGDGRYAFDYERVVKACAQNGKIVEINAHSFLARPGSHDNCRAIARCCARHGVRVVVSSDAHFAGSIGAFEQSVAMLEEIGFPEELVLNADLNRFKSYLKQKTGRDFA